MSDRISIRAGDLAAAHQRQTFVTGKASPPSHRKQDSLISLNFLYR